MTCLESRIENLEKKLLCSNDNMPDCIIICPESARLDAVPDESDIIRLISGDITYCREPEESEEDFIVRAAEAAKALLSHRAAVPCLLAATEKSLADSSS